MLVLVREAIPANDAGSAAPVSADDQHDDHQHGVDDQDDRDD
ncbi:hypothetical protein [Saccharopolyspora spinosa]|uniref:Uncharacterized protein n=1 Tax=Saccharopolyspora spinosa TaxID=60894 RepID=A0A2N3XRC5_SACSN|nr:hypothetical protein [Saccharopolyspora spinosa]PKW13228.1 hypothetical protein A8926_0737 [Saccharopolyspora spinosa]